MSRLSYRDTFDTLNALSRHQALTPAQSAALERAIAKIEAQGGRRPARRRWEPHELDAAKRILRLQGPGRPRREDEIHVAALARELERSPVAVSQCLKRLRFAIRDGGSGVPEFQLALELRA